MKRPNEQIDLNETLQIEIETNEEFGLDFYAELIRKFVNSQPNPTSERDSKSTPPSSE